MLAEVLSFAGLRCDPNVLTRFPESLPSQNFKWQQALSPAQIETIVRIQRSLLLRLGYGV